MHITAGTPSDNTPQPHSQETQAFDLDAHMLPVAVNEQAVHHFKFYLSHGIQAGIRHENELYGLVYECEPENRLQAYQLACELIWQGSPVVVTRSSFRYAVWISLRSLTYGAWSTTGADSTRPLSA